MIVPNYFLEHRVIISNKLERVFLAFKQGERVKIIGESEDPHRIYHIKMSSKSHDGIITYILESETGMVSRLYYETEYSTLKRVQV